MSVTLRIEGPDWTLYEQQVTPTGHKVTPASGGQARRCDGCGGVGVGCAPGNTFTSTLDDVVSTWDGAWYDSLSDFLITSIEGIRATETSYWQLYVNGKPLGKGGCQSKIVPGDSLLAAWSDLPLSPWSLLYASVNKSTVSPGEEVTVSVWTKGSGGVKVLVGGANVGGKQTDLNGQVKLKFDYPAVKKLKATRTGFIRSVTVTVTVKSA